MVIAYIKTDVCGFRIQNNRWKMAPYLLVCMNCGLYLKGQPAEVQEICAQHMCDPFTTKMRKSVIECKAILDTLAADGQIDMDIDSSNNSSSIIG